MDLLLLFLMIPSILTFASCSYFLLLFTQNKTIRLTFTMWHIATLQLLNLSTALLCLFFIIYPESDTFCEIFGFIWSALVIFQSLWVIVISTYIYLVFCLKRDNKTFYYIRSLLIVSILSLSEPAIALINGCYKNKENICYSDCSHAFNTALEYIYGIALIFGLIWCIFSNYKLNVMIWNSAGKSIKTINSSLMRLWVFPLVNFTAIAPGYFVFIVFKNDLEYSLGIICLYFYSAIGFINFLVIGYTPEFEHALNFNKKIKIQEIFFSRF